MSYLTYEEILALDDIEFKELTIPNCYRGWAGRKLVIKQLSRAEQDAYLRRQFGNTKMRQDKKANEITSVNIYGHDAWLVTRGVVHPETHKPLFREADAEKLAQKNGAVIGWIARQILEFSQMTEDVSTLSSLEEEVKN